MLRELAAQQPIRVPESRVVFVGVFQDYPNHTRHSVKVGVSAGTQELLLSLKKKPSCPSSTMGKKSRVKTQKSGSGACAVVSPKEMMNLISELLQKCSSAAPSAGKEWEEYVQIRGLVEKIRKKQKGMSIVFEGSREDHFPDLMSWAQENGASCDSFTVANFGMEGYGLRATREIKAEELFLWIPRKMLMTVESAQNSVLGPLYSQDRILQAMGNVTLAFHLLCERANPASSWLPYIRSLPQEYDTPLFYQQDEVQLLLGTQAVQDILSQYKNTARQYAYFYKLIQTHPAASKLPLKDSFTFDDYRSCIFALHCNEPPISAQLLAFLRVFCMTEEELKDYLLGDRAINRIFTLGNSDFPVSWENEIKLWTFLETRAALLLKTYKTTSEEDRLMLEKPDLSLHSRVAIQLRLAEKQILEKASASGRSKRLHFQKKLEEGAPLPRYEESDIALLENTDADAKLPIILRKLEEVEEGQEIQMEEHSHLLNGEKAVYGLNMEDNGEPVQEETQEKVSKDVNSALDSIGSSTQKGQKEVANLSASRTEDNPKENSE
ncbi:actin-histidine N-methyltransferase isoform X3 [Siniperca chuatsi]|uniref:actin-histidine N-methyltransferase isoform X3 n=1 Tax=Siniperca chuatsi TaxID=119488 RepID=UPI001CE081D9|nr:actin-histidine N-methyltransferase isoform X3 [Siniperca chuatsi]